MTTPLNFQSFVVSRRLLDNFQSFVVSRRYSTIFGLLYIEPFDSIYLVVIIVIHSNPDNIHCATLTICVFCIKK